jgi:hypothetical protein
MPQEGFEPTIPVFEGVKGVHASVRAATMIGLIGTAALCYNPNISNIYTLIDVEVIPFLMETFQNKR